MNGRIGGIKIKIPVSVIILIIAALVMRSKTVLWSLAALIPHESGHVFGAYMTSQKIDSIEIMPFGAAMRLVRSSQSRSDEMFLAACGPAASVFSATLVAGCIKFFPDLIWIQPFISASLLLAAVNLVPALPLDGGRILRAFLGTAFRPITANRLCAGVGVGLGLLLFTYGVYAANQGVVNPSAFMLAVFILAGALSELKHGAYSAVVASSARGNALSERGGSMQLKTVAMRQDVTAMEALRKLRGATLIAVVDDTMHLLGTLAEGDLMQAIVSRGNDVTLDQLIHHTDYATKRLNKRFQS